MMRMETVLQEVQGRIQKMKALEGLKVLNQDDNDILIKLERQAEEFHESSGFMKVVNEGFWATFRREHQIALVLKQGFEIKSRVNELLELRDERGKKIGEWVGDKASQRAGVSQFKLGDFVLHEGVKIKGEPYFLVPEIRFPFLEGMKGIQNVTSCSPAAAVDDLIRGWLDLRAEGLFTRIVGFDIDRDGLA